MGALVNAATLLGSADWRGIITAGAVYQARQVFTEAPDTADHEVRYRLAVQTLTSPTEVVGYLVPLIAADEQVAATYSQSNVLSIPDNLVIPKIANLWTALAKHIIP